MLVSKLALVNPVRVATFRDPLKGLLPYLRHLDVGNVEYALLQTSRVWVVLVSAGMTQKVRQIEATVKERSQHDTSR